MQNISIDNLLNSLKDKGLIATIFAMFFLFKELGVTKSDIINLYRFFFGDISVYYFLSFILVLIVLYNIKALIDIQNNISSKSYLSNRRKQIERAYLNSIGKDKFDKIKDVLIDLLKYYKASRIWFFVYHNGGFTPTGVGKKKMSIIYEATNVGITAIGTRFLDMDINFFPDWVGAFVSKKDVIVRSITDKRLPEQWLFITETSGYKSLYSSGLWTEENMPYGFFGMGFQYETIINEKGLEFYYDTQKKLNEILAQERCYANIL